MASTHFIIYQKIPVNAGIVLDGFKCAYKGTKEEMAKIYRTYFDKAKSLIKMDNGIVMKTFLCNRERAAWLLI